MTKPRKRTAPLARAEDATGLRLLTPELVRVAPGERDQLLQALARALVPSLRRRDPRLDFGRRAS